MIYVIPLKRVYDSITAILELTFIASQSQFCTSSKLNIFVTSCGPLKVALIELVVAQKQALQISQLFIFLAYQFNMAIISPHCDYKVLN